MSLNAMQSTQVTTKSGGDSASTNLYRYEVDSNALVQTGKGIPQWQRGGVSLEWSGPVSKEQKVRLLLLSPFVNLVLSFLRVALITLLALSLVAKARPGLALPKVPVQAAAAAPAIALFALALLGAARAEAQELPGKELLDDLRTRLLRTPPCGEACVTTPDLSLTVKDGTLTIDAEVHAGAPGSWPLPGPAATWVPRGVVLDGKPSFGLVRFADGFLHLRIPAGVHRVSLSGPLPSRDSVALEFSATPKRARATAPGWQVDGIREDGTCDSSVQLSRMLKSGGSGLDAAEAVYEPWFEVVRTLDIGVTWRVETVINRVTPAGAPAVLKVPMLKGMLATGTQEVKDGEVIVSMGRDQEQARWSSTLPPVEGQEVTLRAPEGKAWSEVWIVKSSPLWQIAAKGIAPVKRQEGGLLLAEFRPWPGEEVTLVFRKPAGVPGETLTLDGVTLEARPGKRLSDASLTISARASRSGPLAITLPKGAEIQSLTVDGAKKAIRPDGETVTLTIDPGRRQVVVTWQTKQGITAMFRQPRVKLVPGAVNVFTVMRVPEGRWVLFAGGPRWGPSVLFWGELLVILLAAFLAGRIPLSPLRSWQWVLLALGLSQIPLVFGLVVAAWFFVFAAREKGGLEKPVTHNIVQVFLVGWTLVFLVGLYATVHQGLLLRPDMQITGNGSNDTLLRWYVDRIAGELPAAWTLSVPLWVYKGLMLAWALWLATSLVKWLGWGFRAFSVDGGWKELPAVSYPATVAAPASSAAPPPPPLLVPEPPESAEGASPVIPGEEKEKGKKVD
ncbi:MAG: hypothetical protein JNK60_02500 [Acidobacteria bacterium]|nr:hypothetical protein [Acidobacteriota bacterium]